MSNTETLERIVRATAVALKQASAELGELDSVAGDGDHGIAMETAATHILARLDAETIEDESSLLAVVGAEFSAVGGSMGALLSVVLDDLGEALPPTGRALESGDVVRYLTITRDALTDLGGAEPGDKTIVDAVAAAQAASAAAQEAGDSAPAVLVAAAEGARKGADSTADMVARIGRASRLGERSRGSVDAGARSFALALAAIAQAYSTEVLK